MKKLVVFSIVTIFVTLGVLSFKSAQAQDKDKKKIEEREDKPKGRTAITVAVEQVRVDVTVQDKNGNLIQGLKKEHFKIYEDKVLQEVSNFAPIEAPMTVVLVVEYSKGRVIPYEQLWWEMLWEVILASYTFVEQMRPEDWVAVIAYDIKPEILVDFTQNKAEVYDALRRLNFPAFRESNLYDTITDTLDRLQGTEGRTAVVLVSSGVDTFSKKNLDETLKRVKEANTNTIIHAVSIGGNVRARYDQYFSDSSRMDLYQADAVLKAFAKYTGGQAFFPRFESEFHGIFQTISGLLRNQYSLSYIPTNTEKDGKYRKIKVEVDVDINGDGKPEDLKVSHREGYQAEKERAD